MADLPSGYSWQGGSFGTRWSEAPAPFYPAPVATPPPPVPPTTPPVPAAVAPLDPQQLAAVLYDKAIPLGYSTRSQWGGRIIEGPVFGTVDSERVVSFIAGYYIPVNFWDATRTVTELYFRGQLAWRLSGALMSGLNVGVATVSGAQTVRFATGTLAQTPDAWSVARYGAQAVAYVPLVTATFENMRIAQFGNIVPFTSVTVEDTAAGSPGDLVAWADAIEQLARHDGRTAEEFETVDVSGGINALILGSKIDFIEFLGGTRKHKPQWNIRTGEKLRLVEKGGFSLDLTLELAKLIDHGAQPIVVHTSDAFDKPREKICHYLDVDRDYEPSNVRVAEDIDPVVSTDALQSDSYDIPVASTADIVMTETSFAYYTSEVARQKSEFTGMAHYLGLEPGDCYKWTSAAGRTYYHRVNEIVRRADFTVDAKGEGFLNCAIEGAGVGGGLSISSLVGLLFPTWSTASNGDACIANFGASSFIGAVPSGYTAGFPAGPTSWNPSDLTQVALSGGDLTATSTGINCGVRAVSGKRSGRFYWEQTLAANANSATGMSLAGANLVSLGGNQAGTVVLVKNGSIHINGLNSGSGLGSRVSGDVIGIAVNLDAGLIWFRAAPSGDWNGDPTANPI
jgi:Putative phage tail protein